MSEAMSFPNSAVSFTDFTSYLLCGKQTQALQGERILPQTTYFSLGSRSLPKESHSPDVVREISVQSVERKSLSQLPSFARLGI